MHGSRKVFIFIVVFGVTPSDLITMTKSKLDFFAQLLEEAKNGTTRGQVASQVGMPRKLVDDSLTLLADLNLLTKARNSPVSFATTQKGLRFLQDYQRLKQQFSSGRSVEERP